MSRIALAQIKASITKAENLKTALGLIREAKNKNASLVAFPEFLMAYSPADQSAEELCALAESLEGEFTSRIREAARENGIEVIATIYERSERPERVYDAAIVIDSDGKLSGVYRKLHLYDALGLRESDKLVPGRGLLEPVKTAAGKTGIMICYDVRFPEMARILALKGAQTLVVPSGWVAGEMKIEHWQTMLRARAIENGCYVIAPDQVGSIYIGHSMVIDPFGRVMVDMEEKEGLAIADLEPAVVEEVREKLPLLRHRREDVYGKPF